MTDLDRLFRTADATPTAHAPGAPGRATLTSRLAPRPIIQRAAADHPGVAADAGAAVDRAASSAGAALPESVRARFESSLGADLSSVRVHTGDASADAARAVGARAYTVGDDIHFADGQYAPSDPFGLHLLAHEVAHTQQQAGAAPARQHKLEVSTPGDAAELEADRAADAMISGAPAQITSIGGGAVARKEEAESEGAKSTLEHDGTQLDVTGKSVALGQEVDLVERAGIEGLKVPLGNPALFLEAKPIAKASYKAASGDAGAKLTGEGEIGGSIAILAGGSLLGVELVGGYEYSATFKSGVEVSRKPEGDIEVKLGGGEVKGALKGKIEAKLGKLKQSLEVPIGQLDLLKIAPATWSSAEGVKFSGKPVEPGPSIEALIEAGGRLATKAKELLDKGVDSVLPGGGSTGENERQAALNKSDDDFVAEWHAVAARYDLHDVAGYWLPPKDDSYYYAQLHAVWNEDDKNGKTNESLAKRAQVEVELGEAVAAAKQRKAQRTQGKHDIHDYEEARRQQSVPASQTDGLIDSGQCVPAAEAPHAGAQDLPVPANVLAEVQHRVQAHQLTGDVGGYRFHYVGPEVAITPPGGITKWLPCPAPQ